MRHNFGKTFRAWPTRSGKIIILVLLLLLFSAWNAGENLLYLVFGGVAGLFLLSIIAGYGSLRKVTLHREAPYAVYRNEPFACSVRIGNYKRIIPSISLRIEHDKKVKGYVLRIPAGHQATVAIEETFHRRGVYTLPAVNLSTSYPFGFLQLHRSYIDSVEVLVYPRIRPARLSSRETMSGAQNVLSRIEGEGDEFFALREYVYGDDLRMIVWRISARLGKWMVREMGIGNARIVMFVLDTRRTGQPDYEEQFEEMIDLAGSLMVSLLKHQYSVGLFSPDRMLACGRGISQERHLLDHLTRIMPVEAKDYPEFEIRARRLTSEPMRVIGMSPDSGLWGQANSISGIAILDPGDVIYA